MLSLSSQPGPAEKYRFSPELSQSVSYKPNATILFTAHGSLLKSPKIRNRNETSRDAVKTRAPISFFKRSERSEMKLVNKTMRRYVMYLQHLLILSNGLVRVSLHSIWLLACFQRWGTEPSSFSRDVCEQVQIQV